MFCLNVVLNVSASYIVLYLFVFCKYRIRKFYGPYKITSFSEPEKMRFKKGTSAGSEQQDNDKEQQPKTNKKTEAQRRWREKIKSNEAKHEEAKQKDRERKKAKRNELSQQVKKDKRLLLSVREKKKIEMRKYRAKKKQSSKENMTDDDEWVDEVPVRSNSVETKKGGTKRMQKKATRQRKKSEREKRRIDVLKKKKAIITTQKWRMRIKLLERKDDAVESTNQEPFKCRQTKFRAVKRAKQSLPQTPMRRASIVKKLTESPSTNKILAGQNVLLTPAATKNLRLGETALESLSLALSTTKRSGTAPKEINHAYNTLRKIAVGRIAKKYKQVKKMSTYLNIRKRKQDSDREWWRPKLRKRRKDAISELCRQQVYNFFLLPEVSRENPCKKDVIKVLDKKTGTKVPTAKQTMVITMEAAYKLFQSPQFYSGVKIGFTSFCKLKPPQVRYISETNRRTCLCQICCNLSLKCETLQKLQTRLLKEPEFEVLATNMLYKKNYVSDATLCKYEEFPDAKCIERKCDNCGTEKLLDLYRDLLEKAQGEIVNYSHWEYITVEKDDQMKRVISCVSKEVPLPEFIDLLKEESSNYPAHIFRANWQHRQMALCMETLQNNEAMMVMDFAENYACRYSNEVSSAYFDPMQVTIHPMMVYYYDETNQRTGVSGDEPESDSVEMVNGGSGGDEGSRSTENVIPDSALEQAAGQNRILVKHSITGISNSKKHDSFAVKVFEEKAVALLEKSGKTFSAIHQWTDGCAAQYKCKAAFARLTHRIPPEFPIVNRNFFETSHGKSVCDGLGAVVKNTAYHAVISGKRIIAGAEDLYLHCKDTLQHEKKELPGVSSVQRCRDFVFVDATDIIRNTPDTCVKPVKGTRQLHAVRGVGRPNELEVRKLSCYCPTCRGNLAGPCSNNKYVEPWTKTQIVLAKISILLACLAGFGCFSVSHSVNNAWLWLLLVNYHNRFCFLCSISRASFLLAPPICTFFLYYRAQGSQEIPSTDLASEDLPDEIEAEPLQMEPKKRYLPYL